MSSANNSQNVSSDDDLSERNISDGLTSSGNSVSPDSASPSANDTHTLHNPSISNHTQQSANPAAAGGVATAAVDPTGNPPNNPAERPRWSQTIGTAIFSYDPVTRRLIPLGGTAPVTTWQTANPLAVNNGAPAGFAGTGAGGNPANGANSFGGMPFFPEEGASMSTHLSFSTPDGRSIPIAVMRQLLGGLPGGMQPTMTQLLNQNATAQQPPQPLPFQALPQRLPAQLVGPFPDMDTADGLSIPNQPPSQRTRASSGPPFPTPVPQSNAPISTGPLPPFAFPQPQQLNPATMPAPTAGTPSNQTDGQPDSGAQPTAEGRARNAFITLWDPVQRRFIHTATPMPDTGPAPPITGHGMGWNVPVMDTDGNVRTRFVGWGATVGGMGMGIPGLDIERPPDTRRAKELLRGLNLVPRGLVRRMERVEKMLGEEGTEGGRLVCAVCYDPLLGPSVPLHTEDEVDVAMDGHAPPTEVMDVTGDSNPEPSQDDSTAKAKQKLKPKHPSLDPTALVALPCTHVFHAVECLLPWFEQGKTTCPTCRFDVDPRSETLNIGRWLGGAARRRQAAAAASTGHGTAQAPGLSTEAAPPAAVQMDVEQEDDEVDAFAAEDEGVPAELDPNQLFREAIGRAVATALSNALMNQIIPQANILPGENQTATTSGANPAADNANGSDRAAGRHGDAPSGPQSQAVRDRTSAELANELYPGLMDGNVEMLDADIELPGANRDQFGRMFRDDGESSIAATANSTPRTVTSDLLPPLERVQTSLPRGVRAQAPSPSPPLASNTSSVDRTLPESGLLNATTSTTQAFERAAPRRYPTRSQYQPQATAAQDTPIPGPSNSGSSTAPSSSRPVTPFRHHPYANSRPSSSMNTRAQAGQAPAQDVPRPQSSVLENIPAGPGPVVTGPNEELIYQRQDGNGRVSITRHSISFNLALPPSDFFNLPIPVAPPLHQQQQPDVPGRVPEFLSNIFHRTGMFRPPPPPPPTTTTNEAPSVDRTERPPQRPRKKWVAPEGTSLRSVIESKERQVGLRCDDVSCLWGPEDDDEETVEVKIHVDRTYLRKTASDATASCAHRYHPKCLLVASRIAEAGLDREIDTAEGGDWLEVCCPFCRVHGGQEKSEWKTHRILADEV